MTHIFVFVRKWSHRKMYKIPIIKPSTQIELLKYLDGKNVCSPTRCNFIIYSNYSGHTLDYKQHWMENEFGYIVGLCGSFIGMQEIFYLSDLSETLSLVCKDGDINRFVDLLFSNLCAFEDTVIRVIDECVLNVPYEILKLKFLREYICNPIIACCMDENCFMENLFRMLISELHADQPSISYDKFRLFIKDTNSIVASKYSWYHSLYFDATVFTSLDKHSQMFRSEDRVLWRLFQWRYYRSKKDPEELAD